MTYYKVKPEYGNTTLYKLNKHNERRYNGILIARELYTPAERAKLMVTDDAFEIVEVSKRRIYWFFGARFEI